jgi:hypothetical protein
MNGRIERTDGRLEFMSEDNYANVDFFFADNERRRKIRRRIEGWLAFACFVGYMWLIIWGGVRR